MTVDVNTAVLALIVLQLQRLIPLLRAMVARDALLERIAEKLGVADDESVSRMGPLRDVDPVGEDTQVNQPTQIGPAPAPAPASSAALGGSR